MADELIATTMRHQLQQRIFTVRGQCELLKHSSVFAHMEASGLTVMGRLKEVGYGG